MSSTLRLSMLGAVALLLAGWTGMAAGQRPDADQPSREAQEARSDKTPQYGAGAGRGVSGIDFGQVDGPSKGETVIDTKKSGTAAEPSAKTDSARAEADGRLLRHVVLYQFKSDLPPEQLQEIIDTFADLPNKIDTIVDFEMGTNVSPEGKSEGLTHAFVVTFRNEAGRDAYLVHPAHKHYVSVVSGKREKVVVFDYWTQPARNPHP